MNGKLSQETNRKVKRRKRDMSKGKVDDGRILG